MRKRLLPLLLLALSAGWGLASIEPGNGPKFPNPGSQLPASFTVFDINGKKAKDRYHCLVCEFQLYPVVMVFVREGQDANDAALKDLLKKLDDQLGMHQQDSFLHGFVVFLSPDAKSAVWHPPGDNVELLIKESLATDKLKGRLQELVKSLDLNHLVVSYHPAEGPKGYNLSKEPGVTVVLYHKHTVSWSKHFAEGKLNADGVMEVSKGVEKLVEAVKKPVPPADK